MADVPRDLADDTLAALRRQHDRLAAVVGELSDEDLVRPSGAAEWRVCDVLSHLGSGAEIFRFPVAAALAGDPVQEVDAPGIWARWDAATPREQATWFVDHDEKLVSTLEAVPAEQRDALRIDLGFLPEPAPLVLVGGMRLNEVTLHSWDVLVGLDAAATADEDAADLLLDLLAGPLAFLLGFGSRPGELAEPAVVDLHGRRGLAVEDDVRIVDETPAAPTAHFAGSAEAALRLLGGRLAPEVTPEGTAVSGNVSLDDLRRVFPGY